MDSSSYNPARASRMPDNALTQLVRRLEAATLRLEDIANSGAASSENVAAPQASVHSNSALSEALPPSIADLDILMSDDLASFLTIASEIDPAVSEQAVAFSDAFHSQRQYILLSNIARKPAPDSPDFQKLYGGIESDITAIDHIKERNKTSPVKDHISMLSAGSEIFRWVGVEHSPADYVTAFIEASQFYGNRILKEYREKDQSHVSFVKSYLSLLGALERFVKLHFPTGIQWNASGVPLSEAIGRLGSVSQQTPGPSRQGSTAPPPPPPPPPAPPAPPAPGLPSVSANAKSVGGDMGAVFAQLNQGDSVTSGLRKVDKSEMTHKNPALRAAGIIKDAAHSVGQQAASLIGVDSMTSVTSKSPKTELDGNKWIIEHHKDPASPIDIEASISHSILVSNCQNTTIKVNGKANAISVDNCSRTNIVIDRLVSSVDVVKCPNFALQVLGSLPTIMLDQVNGASIYLSKDSLATEVYTSKCSGVNINLPPAKEEDDYHECPVPEQIRTVVKNGALTSEVVEHSG